MRRRWAGALGRVGVRCASMYRSMWAVSLLVAGVAVAGTVDDPVWVREAVRVSFPGATVRESTREAWEEEGWHPEESPYYLERNTYWEVVGKAGEEEEHYASSVTGEEPDSRRRVVRARFIVGASGRERRPVYAGLFTYSFSGVTHCNQCSSVGRVSLLTWREGRWRAETAQLHGANAGIRSARLLDITGDDQPELFVELGGWVNAMNMIDFFVFDSTGGRLRQIAWVETRGDSTHSGFEHERYGKQLDVAKTRATGGRELVFRVTKWWRKGVRLRVPEVSEERVAVKRGGVPAAAPSPPAH